MIYCMISGFFFSSTSTNWVDWVLADSDSGAMTDIHMINWSFKRSLRFSTAITQTLICAVLSIFAALYYRKMLNDIFINKWNSKKGGKMKKNKIKIVENLVFSYFYISPHRLTLDHFIRVFRTIRNQNIILIWLFCIVHNSNNHTCSAFFLSIQLLKYYRQLHSFLVLIRLVKL